MDLGLKGKVAMVSGASRGLGFAIAQQLAAEGASVSILSRGQDAVNEAARQIHAEHGTQALGFAGDVRSAEAIDQWHETTMEVFGRIDMLVANAGGPPAGNFAAFDDAAWQNAFELLVLSAVRMARRSIEKMTAGTGGSILFLTSSSVKEPIPNLALSTILRPSVSALAKTLTNEYASRRIRVNHLIPGRISTDRVRELDEAASQRLGIPVEEQQRRSAATIPLGRYGLPEELARAAVFLLSDAASYITGATLQVDGGMIRSVL
ncbi:MAG TPA: SDR family oxidoreductase [Terriglobia bacterium]|nr:SDR family oxidoreductase [Terriglobia bacterium]